MTGRKLVPETEREKSIRFLLRYLEQNAQTPIAVLLGRLPQKVSDVELTSFLIKNSLPIAIGEKLKGLRLEIGYSTTAVSNATGMSLGSINYIERGENSPSFSSVVKLAKFYGVRISDLLDEET